MDSWLYHTDAEIDKEIFTIAEEKTGLKNIKTTGVFFCFVKFVVKAVLIIYEFLRYLHTQVSLDKATGFFLDCWGRALGVDRKQATKTLGTVSATAQDSLQIAAGKWLQATDSGLRFKVREDFIQTGPGTFQFRVEAEFPGSEYNLTENTAVHFPKVVPGLESVVLPADWIDEYGQDRETEDPYRERITEKWRAQGEGAPPSRYVYLARAITGVRDAKVVRTPRGWGSMDLVILAENGIPSQELLAKINTVMEKNGLVCRDLQIKVPTEYPVDFDIIFTGDYTKEEIRTAVRDYLQTCELGEGFSVFGFYKHLADYTFKSFLLETPDSDIPLQATELLTEGMITINKGE